MFLFLRAWSYVNRNRPSQLSHVLMGPCCLKDKGLTPWILASPFPICSNPTFPPRSACRCHVPGTMGNVCHFSKAVFTGRPSAPNSINDAFPMGQYLSITFSNSLKLHFLECSVSKILLSPRTHHHGHCQNLCRSSLSSVMRITVMNLGSCLEHQQLCRPLWASHLSFGALTLLLILCG